MSLTDNEKAIVKLAKTMQLSSNFSCPLAEKRVSLAYNDIPLIQYYNRHRKNFLSELFHENTKMRRYQKEAGFSTQIFSSPEMLLSTALATSKKSGKRISLPKDDLSVNSNVGDVLKARRSIRNFKNLPIPYSDLSRILFYTYGITGRLPTVTSFGDMGVKVFLPLRASPSGGALYPIDVYVGALNVENVSSGIYFYDPADHALVLVNQEVKELVEAFVPLPLGSSEIRDAGMIVLFSAVFFRTKAKYGERGYRYILQEAGHLAQNIYIVGTALNLGVVAFEGFYDDEVNSVLGIDGVEEAVVYSVIVGSVQSETK